MTSLRIIRVIRELVSISELFAPKTYPYFTRNPQLNKENFN